MGSRSSRTSTSRHIEQRYAEQQLSGSLSRAGRGQDRGGGGGAASAAAMELVFPAMAFGLLLDEERRREGKRIENEERRERNGRGRKWGPSVVKEIFIGLTLGLVAGGMWKMHHWNEQRKTRSFYDMLDKGQISVVVQE
ncbi:hypothetical protein BRADI_1g17046v3 [Brachypodium distachyon]|uniref:Cytochrome c oxidase subunit 5C n=1 Tax=Brachypodium distachyon TaxID=15368 RepID=A0A0Q3KTT8_BRADI|nr:hypothetical protein BRADI_1g17046v3 [Brachypodium distachyon]